MPPGSTAESTVQEIEPPSDSSVTELAVGGMTCGNCVRHVVEAIQGVPGVQSASASVETNRATVRWDSPAMRDTQAVLQAVQEAGYDAKVLLPGSQGSAARKFGGWQLNLWIGLLGTLPLMAGEWVLGLASVSWFRWFSFAVASLVQVFAGAPFYRGAWKQLKAGSSNMDTLVALGSTAAYAYSAYAMLAGTGGHTYFMEAAAIISLISIGHWMEARVSARASSALRALLNLAPEQTRRLNPDGGEVLVPLKELQIADRVALRPGDRIPTDGEVVDGESAVDESMLTGESRPVDKSAGKPVYAGTVNVNGRLTVRVTALGDATALARIIAAVQRAQTSRANIQRLGDRISNVFVPIVVVIALLAGIGWGFFPEHAHQIHHWLGQYLWPAHLPSEKIALPIMIAVSVLIIACPCAMGLATPAAIMAGSNAAAQRGILIRDGVALEKAGNITSVLFDKTGTLTRGKPEVSAVWMPEHSPAPDQVKAVAVALASHSNHPVSQAISRLSQTHVELITWEEVAGSGVSGQIHTSEGQTLSPVRSARLGSIKWLESNQVNLSNAGVFIESSTREGATVVGLALDRDLAGLFSVKDALKPGAKQVVARLQKEGFRTFLVTGDNARTAASIAAQLGIQPEQVMAEIRPEQKAELVKRLQREGQRVAFVGDGINDAPALEQADLGIAVSRASDIAREAADIILLNSEIEAVPESLGLARATLRVIKQNLFWAFFYNAVGIPLAAFGFMSPILCAAAMGCSDLVVIGNALRLRWRRLDLSR